MSDFAYNGSYEGRREALAKQAAGDRLVCSVCGAPLAVSSLAIRCTADESHVSVHILRRAPEEVARVAATAADEPIAA